MCFIINELNFLVGRYSAPREGLICWLSVTCPPRGFVTDGGDSRGEEAVANHEVICRLRAGLHWIGVLSLVERYHLVFRYKGFHYAPADEVGGGADAEDYEVAGRFP